jgi:DNA-binding transcriptional LysR family regulator
MRYTLRQLEVFLETARNGNVSRAAESLSMSQSAASGALRDFEGQFDVQLFDRVGKRLKINELGSIIQLKAESLLAQAEDLEQALLGSDEVGKLQLGATLTIGNYLAVPMIASFQETFPKARVALTVGNTASIAAQVRNYELDLGMIEGEIHDAELELIHWRDDELVVFAAPGHPYAQLAAVTDEQLLNTPWVVREPGSGTRQTFDRAMTGILPDLDLSLELQHTEAIKRAVEAGLGLGCLSRISLIDAFRRGSLVPVTIPHRHFQRRLSIILHRDKYRGPGLRQWLSLCQQAAHTNY